MRKRKTTRAAVVGEFPIAGTALILLFSGHLRRMITGQHLAATGVDFIGQAE